jgi:hypothetical protein
MTIDDFIAQTRHLDGITFTKTWHSRGIRYECSFYLADRQRYSGAVAVSALDLKESNGDAESCALQRLLSIVLTKL